MASARWDELWRVGTGVRASSMDRGIWRALAAAVPFRGRRVLELGAGRGLLSFLALRAGAAEVTLVDSSPAAIRIARSLFQPTEAASFVICDLHDYHPQQKFDIVFSSGVLEHFRGAEQRAAMLAHRELSRRWVAVVVPTLYHLNAIVCRTRTFREYYGWERPISPRKMRTLMVGAGLRPTRLRRFDVLYNLRPTLLTSRLGLPRVDRRLARWAAQVEAWAERSGTNARVRAWAHAFDPLLGGLLLGVARVPD